MYLACVAILSSRNPFVEGGFAPLTRVWIPNATNITSEIVRAGPTRPDSTAVDGITVRTKGFVHYRCLPLLCWCIVA
jgi:hypothetical protein